jgi:hypothetical protein
MVLRGSSIRAHFPLLLAALLSFACESGPTIYVGRAPGTGDAGPENEDAEASDESERGDSGERDDDEDDDDDLPCRESDDCPAQEPLCHPERLICVDCVTDRDCKSWEECRRGDCEDD